MMDLTERVNVGTAEDKPTFGRTKRQHRGRGPKGDGAHGHLSAARSAFDKGDHDGARKAAFAFIRTLSPAVKAEVKDILSGNEEQAPTPAITAAEKPKSAGPSRVMLALRAKKK